MHKPMGGRSLLQPGLSWGAWLAPQALWLVALRRQDTQVRVERVEHLHSPVGLAHPHASDAWLMQQMRAWAAPGPWALRRLHLALDESLCVCGSRPLPGAVPAGLQRAQALLEAAAHWGLEPSQMAIDVHTETSGAFCSMHWVACPQERLQHWRSGWRAAGWRLALVEPQAQAIARAWAHRGEAAGWQEGRSPRDWRLAWPRPADPPPGPLPPLPAELCPVLAACGAALGAWS